MENKIGKDDMFNWVAVDSIEEYENVRNYLFEHQPQLESMIASHSASKNEKLLSQRELDVLKLLMEYKTNTEIAKELVISINTVKKHVGSIIKKLEVYDRVCAAEKAERTNILNKNE